MTSHAVTDAERDLILHAADSGTSWTLIARLMGRQRKTVTRICLLAKRQRGGKADHHHGRGWTAPEIMRISQLVPAIGYLQASKILNRDHTVIRDLCLRLGIASPLKPGRPRKKQEPTTPQETSP